MKMRPREIRGTSRKGPTKPAERSLRAFFEEREEIRLAYLFGSYFTGTPSFFHDIDVGVLVMPDRLRSLDRELPYGYRVDLTMKLEKVLRYNPVDLVLLNGAPPLLKRRIIGTGKLVFCRSETERIGFEVASLKEHADTAHIRRIKRFHMNQRIEKGLAAYG
jgi:hypothetical protein